MSEDYERVVAVANRHWISLSSAMVWAIVIGLLAGVIFFLLPAGVRSAPYFPRSIAAAGAVLWAIVSASRVSEWSSTVYVVTPRRIVMRRGLLRKKVTEVGLEQVGRYSVYQGILGRVLGYGTVRVELKNGSWWTMRRLARPSVLVDGIGKAIRESHYRRGD
ncbi:MAG: hypothetical protein C4318_08960 [Acidimicrobiia bacterium]